MKHGDGRGKCPACPGESDRPRARMVNPVSDGGSSIGSLSLCIKGVTGSARVAIMERMSHGHIIRRAVHGKFGPLSQTF